MNTLFAKHILIPVAIFAGMTAAATAQLKPTPNPTTPIVSPESKVEAQALARADLELTNAQVTLPSGSPRVIHVVVKNIGKKASAACNLKVRYSWRMDHEPSSNRELIVNYPIPQIAYLAGHAPYSATILVTIPDGQIHSNEGFGSANVGISFEADSNHQMLEENESNNTAGMSVAILH